VLIRLTGFMIVASATVIRAPLVCCAGRRCFQILEFVVHGCFLNSVHSLRTMICPSPPRPAGRPLQPMPALPVLEGAEFAREFPR